VDHALSLLIGEPQGSRGAYANTSKQWRRGVEGLLGDLLQARSSGKAKGWRPSTYAPGLRTLVADQSRAPIENEPLQRESPLEWFRSQSGFTMSSKASVVVGLTPAVSCFEQIEAYASTARAPPGIAGRDRVRPRMPTR
jgi:hypothetical protein